MTTDDIPCFFDDTIVVFRGVIFEADFLVFRFAALFRLWNLRFRLEELLDAKEIAKDMQLNSFLAQPGKWLREARRQLFGIVVGLSPKHKTSEGSKAAILNIFLAQLGKWNQESRKRRFGPILGSGRKMAPGCPKGTI